MSSALRHIEDKGSEHHIVCFPYAGAGSDAFAGLRAFLPAGVDLWAVDLAGRLRRADEPPALKFTQAVNDLTQAIVNRFGDETPMFYGHSMGGYLAVETALRIEELGHEPVAHVTVGACASYDQVELSRLRALAHADDATLLGVVGGWGLPIPRGLLASPAAMVVALRGLRLDLALLSTHTAPSLSRLAAPMSALYGATDPDVRARQCEGWAQRTSSWNGATELDGGHLFIATQTQRVAALLAASLEAWHSDHE